MPEHVRNEIHTRVERFKARRRGQTLPLPFEEQVLPEAANVVAFPTLEPEPPSKPARSRAARELTHAEPVISPAAISTDAAALIGAVASEPEAALVAPPAVEPAAVVLPAAALPAEPAPARKPHVPQFPLFVPPAEQPATEWSNFHIASLGKRLSGIGYDLGYILGGLLLFAAPFYWIAGKPPLNLGMLAAFICGALLISVLYGCLFMAVMGETPGMTATGLRVVSFGGHRASLPQRLLRVVGAVVSAGSFLMGYVWAFIDEERLSWHDHISKTVLTDSAE